jgi:hypothetical protein
MGETPLTPIDTRNARKEDTPQNSILSAALNDLNYCLDALKIEKNAIEFHQNITELFIKDFASEDLALYSIRIVVLKFIVDFIASPNFGHIMPQSQLYDFLTLATEGIREQRRVLGTKDIVFKIYRDIMENYQNSDTLLRINYPAIIVDIVAILDAGLDTSGKRVAVYGVYEYYLTRKSQTNVLPEAKIKNVAKIQHRVMEEHELIQTLIQITGRSEEELEILLTKLNDSDVRKISNLCTNYTRIEKYCRLILTSPKDFRSEVERELGKKLTDNQIQIAAISIRKVAKYIENILDGKFVPHDSHGINHIKHNLEYGYQVMGLIERKRKRSG